MGENIMASEEHLKAAETIKNTHRDLRNLSLQLGPDEAWSRHLKDEATRESYAKSMRELAETHWKNNATSDDRINWAANFCENYFQQDELERLHQRDLRIIEQLKKQGSKIDQPDQPILSADGKLEALDVGSSGNFFRNYERFNILPIDISPSDNSVLFCDFLTVPVEDQLQRDDKKVTAVPANYYHVVIFCLLLEYLPSSIQRITCCEKAYRALKTEGVLVVITPDSNHEMKNSKQIKNWRWTLAKIGFQRVKVEKLKNLTCMSFRKSLDPLIPRRWAESHKEPYMEFKLEIPQDKVNVGGSKKTSEESQYFDVRLMNELPSFE